MTIVFGTDFSGAAEEAGLVAAYLAKESGVALHIVHVSRDTRAPFVLGTVEERLLVDEHRYLGETAGRLRREVDVNITTELLAGTVADALVEAAERRLADVLVLGLAGASNFSARAEPSESTLPRGVTVERVVQRARVPVLGVRMGYRVLNWLQRRESSLRVLLGSDLGAAALRAEAFLERLPKLGELSVHALSVVAPRTAHLRYGLPELPHPDELSAEARALWERDLEAQGAGFAWQGKRRIEVLPSTERPARALVARTEHADLVLIGARKRSWLEQAWSGSVARGLLRESKTSVLCIPQGLAGAEIEARPGFRSVVAATDFTDRGDEALSAVFAITAEGGTVHFVHVLSHAEYDKLGQVDAARRQLHARIPKDHPLHKVCTEVLVGTPADALVAFARRVGADALCLGSHRGSNLEARVLGSTLQDVLARSDLPVLVAPQARP